ncbi:MAG: PKD domain-containing protein [Methanobacteriota archaeon]
MRGRATLGLVLCFLLAPAVVGHPDPAIQHGQTLDVSGLSVPDLVVPGHRFGVSFTVTNKDTRERTFALFAELYRWRDGEECAAGQSGFNAPYQTSLGHVSSTFKVLSLSARSSIGIGEDDWPQVVNGTTIGSDGPYRYCVWAHTDKFCKDGSSPTAGRCPPLQDNHPWYLDHEPARLLVRRTNHEPTIAVRVDRVEGGPTTPFAFEAEVADADDDAVEVAWDFGDGTTGRGARVVHRFAVEGTFRVNATATDGFARVPAAAPIVVTVTGAVEDGPDDETPGPTGLWALLALGVAAALPLRMRVRLRFR